MSDRSNDMFQRALDDARRKDYAAKHGDPGPLQRPHVGVSVPLGPAPSSGGKARFGLALDWTDEITNGAAPPPRPQHQQPANSSGNTSDDIAAELGLGAPQTLDQLALRWRDFVWRNHPDRQPIDARERANARVAIANMLCDRARRSPTTTR
jgi:hypothetical protein